MVSTVDRRPSPVDHTQRPALCTARWWLGLTQSVARSVCVRQALFRFAFIWVKNQVLPLRLLKNFAYFEQVWRFVLEATGVSLFYTAREKSQADLPMSCKSRRLRSITLKLHICSNALIKFPTILRHVATCTVYCFVKHPRLKIAVWRNE